MACVCPHAAVLSLKEIHRDRSLSMMLSYYSWSKTETIRIFNALTQSTRCSLETTGLYNMIKSNHGCQKHVRFGYNDVKQTPYQFLD